MPGPVKASPCGLLRQGKVHLREPDLLDLTHQSLGLTDGRDRQGGCWGTRTHTLKRTEQQIDRLPACVYVCVGVVQVSET